MIENILVSICCTTFNHEKYIGKCLDGFVMQQTNFKFEILVHEDASTDGTAAILREYERNYPHLFRNVYQTENQFKKQNTLTNILFKMAKGKYIALCEGDDYWSDPNKLQKQVGFLESNPDYSMSFHNAEIINDANLLISDSYLEIADKKDISVEELLLNKRYAPTLTLCLRNISKTIPAEMNHAKLGDMFLLSLLGNHGKGKYQADILPSVYRFHSAGIWSMASDLNKKMMARAFYKQISQYYARINKKPEWLYYQNKLTENNSKILHDSIQAEQTKTVILSAFWCLGGNMEILKPKKSFLLVKTLAKYFLRFRFK